MQTNKWRRYFKVTLFGASVIELSLSVLVKFLLDLGRIRLSKSIGHKSALTIGSALSHLVNISKLSEPFVV